MNPMKNGLQELNLTKLRKTILGLNKKVFSYINMRIINTLVRTIYKAGRIK